MMMEILPEPTSNKLCGRRSDKENKQVSPHRSEVHVMMEIPRSSKVKCITACSYSINEYDDMMKAQMYVIQDFRYSDTQKKGLEVTKGEPGLFVSQKKYTLELLQEVYVMLSTPYKLPMDPHLKLQAEMGSPLQDPKGKEILLFLGSQRSKEWFLEARLKQTTKPWQSHVVKLLDFGLKDLHPITLRCDNQVAIHISANRVLHARTKHTEVDCHYVRDFKDGTVKPKYVHTSKQLADVFTKILPVEHHTLLHMLAVSSSDKSHNLRGSIKNNTRA
ncbi:cysteine-rich receptor-like protein kinase 8 [Tanacetum coccineum]